MTALRAYRFEICWLLLLIGLFLFSPARSSANSFMWIDLAFDCDTFRAGASRFTPVSNSSRSKRHKRSDRRNG